MRWVLFRDGHDFIVLPSFAHLFQRQDGMWCIDYMHINDEVDCNNYIDEYPSWKELMKYVMLQDEKRDILKEMRM